MLPSKSGHFIALLSLLVVALSLSSSVACSDEDKCALADCAAPALLVKAPAGEIVSISASGPACTPAEISCIAAQGNLPFQPGCELYYVLLRAAGTCTVHIESKTLAPVDATRTSVDYSSDECCPGYYVDPTQAQPVDIGK